jgi:hypothetical protein
MIRFVFSILVVMTTNSLMAGQEQYRNSVTEVPTCASTLSIVGDDVLHVYNLNNTLIRPVQTLGSDEWFQGLVHRVVSEGTERASAIRRATSQLAKVQRATSVEPLEDLIPYMLNLLMMSRRARIIGLTSRSIGLAAPTSRQLASIGINLSQQEGFGSNQATVLDSEDLVEPIWMKGGVVFVGPYNDPGKALAKLLDPQSGVKKIAQGIKRVVYADAGLTNGQNVLREVRERRPDLDVYAFRVGAGDGVLDGWARILADFQWTQFQEKGVLLSDAEAIRQLNPSKKSQRQNSWRFGCASLCWASRMS